MYVGSYVRMSMYACKYVYLRSCGQSIPQTCVREANPHRFHSDAGGELQDLGPFSRFTVHVFLPRAQGVERLSLRLSSASRQLPM